MYCSQKLGEDFAKFCGLLRIYELYTHTIFTFNDATLAFGTVSGSIFSNSIELHFARETESSKVGFFYVNY